MQFFQQQPPTPAAVQLPQTGCKRKRDDDMDIDLRAPAKRIELESHQNQGSQSPVLSVASISSPMHLDLNMAMVQDDDEPSIRRFQKSQPATYDPWASMREPCSFCERSGACSMHV